MRQGMAEELAVTETPVAVMSDKRIALCSRSNALRVAERLFDDLGGRVSIVRTDSPVQPYRVTTDPEPLERVEVEMRSI